jgi:dihydroxyacetone kinase phosphoprotein-dependent L subunit
VSWNADDVVSVVRVMADALVEREAYFCELDSVVGDGDFGFSLARGFEVVQAEIDAIDRSSPAAVLRRVAMALASKSGGTTGPIWGTAFLRAGGALNDVAEPSGDQVIAALRAAIEGIKQRGNAELGDKTLLDALVPAVDELEAALPEGAGPALERAAATARTSAEATKGMLAQRGRASYTGERSRDSADAGAIGIAVMFEAVSKAVRAAGLETAQ